MKERNCAECGRSFMPQHSQQVCCCKECSHARKHRLDRRSRERCEKAQRVKSKAARRREYLARCDAAWAKAAQPTVTRIETADGRIIERRGPIPWGGGITGSVFA